MPPKAEGKVKKPVVKLVPMEMNTVQEAALVEFLHTCAQTVDLSRLSDNAMKIKYDEYFDCIIGLNTIPYDQVKHWRRKLLNKDKRKGAAKSTHNLPL